MQRTNFGEMACSIARTLDVIGEPWSPLVLRDVYVGMNRFDQIQEDLGISRKVLTERLNHLVTHGILERRPYDNRPRFEYHLTPKGMELFEVLMVMVRWGDRWLAGAAGPPVLYRHHTCGEISSVALRCATCGEPMHAANIDVLPGPGAASPQPR
jgi:DNA-binding HxlR family transcriptional regulator